MICPSCIDLLAIISFPPDGGAADDVDADTDVEFERDVDVDVEAALPPPIPPPMNC